MSTYGSTKSGSRNISASPIQITSLCSKALSISSLNNDSCETRRGKSLGNHRVNLAPMLQIQSRCHSDLFAIQALFRPSVTCSACSFSTCDDYRSTLHRIEQYYRTGKCVLVGGSVVRMASCADRVTDQPGLILSTVCLQSLSLSDSTLRSRLVSVIGSAVWSAI